MINKRFNREETPYDNYYFGNFGFKSKEHRIKYQGFIKCKLVHNKRISLIITDQIFLIIKNKLKWIQPLCFMANYLIKSDTDISCQLNIDISCGNTITIKFFNSSYIRSYQDGSQLFECEISGPEDLEELVTGDAIFDEDYNSYITLFHHTSEEYKKLILKESSFKVSPWNIQGNKKLKKIAYLYLTPLERIKKSGDLIQIAMSSNGTILLKTDNLMQPTVIDDNWIKRNNDDISILNVYRESTKNRKQKIKVLVNTTMLAPQYINQHYFEDTGMYYEVCKPFIHRMGVGSTDQRINFSVGRIDLIGNKTVTFPHLIIGNCSKKEGIEAPYNEEETKEIFKIEFTANKSILEFWFDNANQDHFTDKYIDFENYK